MPESSATEPRVDLACREALDTSHDFVERPNLIAIQINQERKDKVDVIGHYPLHDTNYIHTMTFFRFLILLSLVTWIGALIFFPVVAQISFTVLPSPHLAGLVVRNSLIALHWMAFACGIVFLACSLICNRVLIGRFRVTALGHILVILMLALTAISQFKIIPRMDTLRASAGELSALPAGGSIGAEFNSLHIWSTRIEGAVLILGLLVLYSAARRFSSSNA